MNQCIMCLQCLPLLARDTSSAAVHRKLSEEQVQGAACMPPGHLAAMQAVQANLSVTLETIGSRDNQNPSSA